MTETTENTGVIYEFGRYVLDPHERILFADGKAIHLTDKVFDTLLLLIRHSGRLLTKDEMMAAIWNESFVEEGNLAKNVSRLRKILNTGGGELIETLPRRGYRFLANVKEINVETSLLVHRRLRVKITQTEDEPMLLPGPSPLLIDGKIGRPRWKMALGVLAATAAAASIVGFFFWNRSTPPSGVAPKNGAIRLTNDPKNDNGPVWINEGEIRFYRAGPKEHAVSVSIQSDGTNQTHIKEFEDFGHGRWSPDGTKVVFIRPNDRSSVYLANADGSNEVLLPFAPANFDWSPDSRKIVYQKHVAAGDPDILVYSVETAQSENVTNNPALDADPSFSPDGKQIVFASLRDGNAEIYLMNVDGSDVRRLTNHPAWENHPAFSPDGTTIAFPGDREGENFDVYLMNVDGSNVRRLTDWPSTESVGPGSWSPDGTKIAFVSDREGNDDIFVISAEVFRPELIVADSEANLAFPAVSPDGKQIVYQAETEKKTGEIRIVDTETKRGRVLRETANPDLAPVFSPNGEWIAFHDRIEGNTEICLIKPDGSRFTVLTHDAARDASPAWSPDGRKIAFVSNRGGNFGRYDLYLMNADGGDQRQIYSNTAGMSAFPAWSPDGKEIIFANDKEDGRNGNFEIFKLALGMGETEERLTLRRRADVLPVISPDGKQIVFTSNADGNAEIYVMNSDGTGQMRITRNSAEDSFARWSPDGKRIIFASNRSGKFAIYEIEFPWKDNRGH